MEIEEAKQKLGDEFSFIYNDTLGPVIQLLDIDKEAKMLDVGTGQGRMALSLALNGYSVFTGEPENDFSEYAKQDWLNSAKKVNVDHLITFKAFNAEKMPFGENEFDAVFMMGALHHVNDKRLVINECIRVLKPEGILCIIEPSEKGLEIIKNRRMNHPKSVDPREYIKGLPLEIIKKYMFNAFIFKNIETL